jgi:FkbM family methyltransferase
MLKRIVREAVRAAGYQVSRVPRVPPGAAARPVGELRPFLEDIRWRGFRPKAILDVGANAGEWSRVAKSTFPEAVFTLIEPQVEMKSHLDKFCAETPGSRWINAGAGALVGERSFSVHPNTVSSSFVIPEDGEPTAGTVRIVPIVTLDSVFLKARTRRSLYRS